MICPHCGKLTQNAEKCEHCKQPTEFATRVNYRPEKIPGMSEDSCKPTLAPNSFPKASIKWIIISTSAILILLVSNVIWSLNYSQLLKVHQNMLLDFSSQKIIFEETADTTEETVLAEPAEPVVVLHTNHHWDEIPQLSIDTIQFGQELPVLANTDSHLFCSWNTDPDGLGTSFSPGDLFLIPLSKDLALYAQWEPKITEPFLFDSPTAETIPLTTDEVDVSNDESEEISIIDSTSTEKPVSNTEICETQSPVESSPEKITNDALISSPFEDDV